jgi:UDP-N-acetyl-D-galactosamine dehydrogenase
MKIAIIGLGYVGLPLFSLLSAKYSCWGLDTNQERIQQLIAGYDCKTASKSKDMMMAIQTSHLTSCWDDIKDCTVFIIAVPTPVDSNNKPDTSALRNVCKNVGKILKHNDIVIFESTVYPGATEELCIPIMTQVSGLQINSGYSVGYSPERMNVGDKTHQLSNTTKIVSASNEIALETITSIYKSIINSEIVIAPSIKVAEAAKMYENVQRDVLIALANQYANYCNAEHIDIHEVTRCASSKWNFVNVSPGLVGGHCISVDPYYLLDRANTKNVNLSIVKYSRIANENQPLIIADRIIMKARSLGDTKKQNLLVLGLSYKPNTSDIRNTKVARILTLLKGEFRTIDCFDPLVDADEAKLVYGVDVLTKQSSIKDNYDIVIKLVEHNVFDGIQTNGVLTLSLNDLL